MVTELGGSVFEITHDLVGDLFRAKNAGVTVNLLVYKIYCLYIGLELMNTIEGNCHSSEGTGTNNIQHRMDGC
jgi:hypothetical protein